MKDFKEKLKLVPELPGSYQMKDKNGYIIYVGKAKNLKRRVSSYFRGNVTGKTAMLVSDIDDFEYIVTSSELESLILEINLIKKYNPKYNILLKDDKSYPYIELTNEKYPRLRVVRNVKRHKKNHRLFGPYPNVGAARKTVNMINRLYPLRKCEKLPKKECLYYHINECLGYCVHDVDEKTISDMTNEIVSFLKGNNTFIKEKIKDKMEKASLSMNYEKALAFREMLKDIDITLAKQKIDLKKNYNFDIFAYTRVDNYLSITVFFIRDGILFGKHHETLMTLDNEADDMYQFIIHFYEKNILAHEILIPQTMDPDILSSYLNVKVHVPMRGDLKQLVDLAKENSIVVLNEELTTLQNDEKKKREALLELSNLLGRKVSRMESFDNSHLFGTYYVGAMVVFEDFEPLKNFYRKYKISTDVKDDLSAMREVIYRRYFRAIMDNEVLPDLIVIDGGEAQVKVCKEIIDSLHLDVLIIGLKKDKHHRTSTVIDQDFKVLEIKNNSNLFFYLSKIQEEVHRFAITYYRNIKSKGLFASYLDLVDGIGEVKKKELLKKYGSIKKMKEVSLMELEKIVGKNPAYNLYQVLHEEDNNE